MSVYSLLIVAHIIGTILGVGGATFAEIFHVRAMRDGTITEEEGATLKICYTVLRIGLAILLLSGFSFLIYYRLTGQEELLYSDKLWAKMSIVFIIPINAVLFQIRKIPTWLATAVSLTSWYTALILGIYHDIPYSYFEIIGLYIVAIFMVAFILHRINIHYALARDKKTETNKT